MSKPNSQETAQYLKKHVLHKCLKITFYTYTPMNPQLFIIKKTYHNRCTLIDTPETVPVKINSPSHLVVVEKLEEADDEAVVVEPDGGGNGLLDQHVHVPPGLVVRREEVVEKLLNQSHLPARFSIKIHMKKREK